MIQFDEHIFQRGWNHHPKGHHQNCQVLLMILLMFSTVKPEVCYDGFEPSGRMHIAQGVPWDDLCFFWGERGMQIEGSINY